MATTRAWKVYGKNGEYQRESFNPSARHDWSNSYYGTRIVEIENFDKTGTHHYTIVRITRDTAKACKDELRGHLSDGIFENYRHGKVEEITQEA